MTEPWVLVPPNYPSIKVKLLQDQGNFKAGEIVEMPKKSVEGQLKAGLIELIEPENNTAAPNTTENADKSPHTTELSNQISFRAGRKKGLVVNIHDQLKEVKDIFPVEKAEDLFSSLRQNEIIKRIKIYWPLAELKSTDLGAYFTSHLEEIYKKEVTAENKVEEPEPTIIDDTPQEIKDEALSILKYGKPLDYFKETLDTVHVGDVVIKKKLALSIGASYAKTENLHTEVNGDSSTGKSIIQKAGQLLPPEDVFTYDRVSREFLKFHLNGQNLDGKFVIISEADDFVGGFVRALTSSSSFGVPTAHLSGTVKDQEAVVIDIKGEPTTWSSCVQSPEDEGNQTVNRRNLCHTDNSHEQQVAVFEFQKKVMALGDEKTLLDENRVKTCRAMFRILKANGNIKVEVPKLSELDANKWPSLRNRRMFPQFVAHVKGSARLHQYQRILSDKGNIIAADDDFKIADEVMKAFQIQDEWKLPPAALDILRAIQDLENDDFRAVSAKAIIVKARKPPSTVYRHLELLEQRGAILKEVTGVNEKNGNNLYGYVSVAAKLPEVSQ